MDRQAYTAHVVELTAVNAEENEAILEFAEDGVIILSSLCRICANQSEQVIPIYEGEGLEHELEIKMNKYLPFSIERDSSLPMQCCIQCASTLLAWHELYETSVIADRKLKTLQSSTVQQVVDENDKFENGETTTEEQIIETLSETTDISFPEDSAQRYFGTKIPEIEKNSFSQNCATNENDAPTVKYIRIKTEPIIKEEPLRSGYDNQSNENVKIIKIDFDENVCKQEIGSEYVNPIYLCQKCETTFDNEEQFVNHLNLHEDSSASRKNSSVLGNTSAVIDTNNEQNNTNYLNADQNANKFNNESKFQIKPYTKSGKKLSEQPSIIKIENYSADFRHEMLDHLSAGLKRGKGNIEIVSVNTEPQNVTSCDDMDVTYESTEVENSVLGIIFECEFCLLRFENKSDWLSHEHSYVGDLMCQICGQLYEKQSSLDEHLQQHERAVSLTYENEEEIHLIQDQPMESSYGKCVKISNQNDRTTLFTCSECSEVFNSKVALTSHRRIHKKNVLYSCEICGKKFKSEYRMKNHYFMHEFYNSRYECQVCNLIFTDKISYKNHLNYHMDKKSMLKILTCEICFKVFTRTSNLNSHLTTHIKDHYCIVCCCSFIKQLQLENHMSAHSNEDIAAAQETPQVVGCSYESCGQVFPSRLQCYEHKKIHLELIEYQCDICSKKYPKLSQLVTHQKSHEGDNVCKICHKMFKNQKSLKEHFVLHTDEKKYQCDICFIKFRWQSGLASHKSVHTNVRKYTCGVCKRGFARSSYLKEHLRTHRKEKPFDCKVCGRCFIQTSILRNHMGLVHRTCQICKLMIGNRRQIKIHMWKTHPEFAKSTGIKPVKVNTKSLKNE